jgi:uncharacterized delta-60 repeat protein
VVAPATSSRSRGDARLAFDPTAASVDVGRALAVQRDGTIVVAGLSRRYSRYVFALARYRADGRLDSSFGTGGLALTPFGGGGQGVYAVAEQPRRKLVAVGGASAGERQSGFAVARYTSRGRLDPSFGTGGKVVTRFARRPRRGHFAFAFAADVAVQRDGRIVAAGSQSNVVDATEAVVARYTARGALDRGFGTGGKTLFRGRQAGAGAIAVQGDGKIVITGSSEAPGVVQNQLFVARLTSRGRADRSFGTGGSVVTTLGVSSHGSDLAIQPDGKIVVAGGVGVPGAHLGHLGLVRYLPNGRIDASFGTNGTVVTNFGVYAGPALALQPDGKIVAACALLSPARFGLARYTSDGKLDPSFGEGGKVRTRFAERRTVARDVALTADGKILVAGSAGGDFALARYNRDGSLHTSFGRDGLVRTPLGPAWFRRGR